MIPIVIKLNKLKVIVVNKKLIHLNLETILKEFDLLHEKIYEIYIYLFNFFYL